MLVVEIELLGGRYVATAHNDRSRAEWPPHPARLFSALVAALHDREPVADAERDALLWLEKQDPPQLDVDLNVDESVGMRDVRGVFVPVNDVTLIGDDPERELRKRCGELQELKTVEQTPAIVAQVKKTRKLLDAEKKKLAKIFADQQIASANPNKADLKRGSGLLPERRTRQERSFPVIVPERTSFAFLWPAAQAGEHLDALRWLCGRVTRLGHSSSLVRCAITDRSITPTLVPDSGGEHVLRVVGSGQLERLERAFGRHQAVESRVLPARPQRYGAPHDSHPEVPCSVFTNEWIVYERVGGQRPLASRGSDLALALRRTLIEIHGNADLPTMLSGHEIDGQPSLAPHLAFVPLPWVGHEYADGSVQGLALVLPRSVTSTDRDRLLRLLARWEVERGDTDDDYAVEVGTTADFGHPIRSRFRRIEVPSKVTLKAARWCKPSRHFVTATPIALDEHPGDLRSNIDRTAHKAAAEAEASIKQACERIGLPRPSKVVISLSPLLFGAQHVRQFGPWPPQPVRTRRARVHADIEFDEKVRGPLLIGAGRYLGLGLCLPVAGGIARKDTTR